MQNTGTSLIKDLWWFIENCGGLKQTECTSRFFDLREQVREVLNNDAKSEDNRAVYSVYSLTTNGDSGVAVDLFLSETERNNRFSEIVGAMWERCHPSKTMPNDPFEAYELLIDQPCFLDFVECDIHQLNLEP